MVRLNDFKCHHFFETPFIFTLRSLIGSKDVNFDNFVDKQCDLIQSATHFISVYTSLYQGNDLLSFPPYFIALACSKISTSRMSEYYFAVLPADIQL